MHPFMPFITEHLYQQLVNLQQQHQNQQQLTNQQQQTNKQHQINQPQIPIQQQQQHHSPFPITLSIQDFPKAEMVC